MKNRLREIIEKHEVLHENGTYWNEKLLSDNILKMYDELYDLYENSKIENELLLCDWCHKTYIKNLNK